MSCDWIQSRLRRHSRIQEKNDLATYGKNFGGGFPIGAVAGREDIMAVFSGKAEKNISWGTFNNPFYGGWNCALSFKKHKDIIYPSLMEKGNRLANEINDFCEKNDYPKF